MPQFASRSRDAEGSVVEKTLDAASKRDAMHLLEAAGLSPIRIDELRAAGEPVQPPSSPTREQALADAGDADAARLPRKARLGRRDLMQFSQQLSSSLGAGIAILGGLQSIREQARNDGQRAVFDTLIRDLEGGASLSAAMGRQPRTFPKAYVGTIAAGEASGTLDEMLDDLAEHLEAEMEIRSDVRTAIMYPSIVIGVLCLAITVLVIFVVPRFASFYSGFNAELPLPTRVLIGASDLVTHRAHWLLAGLAGAAWGVWKLLHVPRVRRAVDAALLRVPLIGRLIETSITLHVAQMLGLFTRSGMPALQGMRILAGTMTHTLYRERLDRIAEGIAVGRSLAECLKETNCFSISARQMLANGEATGSLERACFSVSAQYKKDLRYLTKNIATFIEPLLTLVLAGVVLFVALAAFLPMWDLVKVIGH